VILLHDNARSHVAKVVRNTLLVLQCKILYSSNYVPSSGIR